MTDPPHPPSDLPLGRPVDVPDHYDPAVLTSVPRAEVRAAPDIALVGEPPFRGEDLWRAWEFGWQDMRGVPHAAVLELKVPCSSAAIVESKSLKLYLYGIGCSRFPDSAQVTASIRHDLSEVCGGVVGVRMRSLQDVAEAGFDAPVAESLDALRVPVPDAEPGACVPVIQPGPARLQRWHTDLFGSLCPVTGQPDWASVTVHFEGPRLEPASLQRYLLSYRSHAGFHEACAERIFMDLWRAGSPEFLSVHCRFTRRGGIDISPYRASATVDYSAGRLVRQ